jgi:predicted glycoside hydrolase/deacetylase ChbG (UPF0249 family)
MVQAKELTLVEEHNRAQGSVNPKRFLIVNADDFGRSSGVNQGVIWAHENGIVTSASLMVRWPASDEAAAYAKKADRLGLGLHFDIGEWVNTPRGWEPVYQVVSSDDSEAVATELANQLGRFHKLMGRSPTHIDSHQHVHRREPVQSVVRDYARRLSIPVRDMSSGIAYCGSFHGQTGKGDPYPQGITTDALVRLLDDLGPGVTELSCHPGLADDFESVYAAERRAEVEALADTTVIRAVEARGIELISHGDLRVSGSDNFEPHAALTADDGPGSRTPE